MPPWLWITGTVILGLILAVPAILLLGSREGAVASRPPTEGAAEPEALSGVSGLAADITELAHHTIQVFTLAARGDAEAGVIEHLREIESALPPARAAFEALPESAREPVNRAARELQPDWTAAAQRVLDFPGASHELKALTREITLDLKTFASGGYRVEEALEAACERAMAALDSLRLGMVSADEATRLLHHCSQRMGALQPAHDSLSDSDRARAADAARRLLPEVSALAAVAALSPQWSADLRDAATELLGQLTAFAL